MLIDALRRGWCWLAGLWLHSFLATPEHTVFFGWLEPIDLIDEFFLHCLGVVEVVDENDHDQDQVDHAADLADRFHEAFVVSIDVNDLLGVHDLEHEERRTSEVLRGVFFGTCCSVLVSVRKTELHWLEVGVSLDKFLSQRESSVVVDALFDHL